MTKEQQRHLTNLYTIAQKYPGKKTAVIAKLEEFGLTVDDFNAHDSLMVSQNIVEPSSIVDEYPDVPGFTQSDKYSDVKILEIFEARDALESKKAKIGSPPTDAEWFQAGLTAEQRIAELRPFFETKKEEEWENLRSFMATPEGMEGETFLPSGFYEAIGSSITGVLGLGQEMMFGALDATTDFKDVTSHERGFGGSGNIFTGFGAWDLAEFKTNKMTGQRGYSPELLEIEKTLDDLYGQKREYNEQMRDRGYRDVGGIDKEIESLNLLINQDQLLDPRMMGDVQ